MQKPIAALALCLSTGAAWAQSDKEVSCGYQAEVVAAVQKARMDQVAQDKVQAHVSQAADWPEKFNAIIPIVTPWVYDLSDADLEGNDLAQIWNDGCLKR